MVKGPRSDYHREDMKTRITGNQFLDVAVQAATAAGDDIMAAANRIDELEIEQKSINDFVSEVDRQAEQTISTLVRRNFPEHGFVGEEYGDQSDSSSPYKWVVDPLDGTTNFLRSIPHYAVSIALTNLDCVEVGVVYDPCKDELFSAVRGEGARLNGSPINVSAAQDIKGALLATGVPYSGERLQQLNRFTDSLEGLLAHQTSGIRRLGAAALDLAYVAAGRYEGYWEAGLNIWDIAAGALLVEEAGGTVSDLTGGEYYLSSGDVLAATPAVHSDMLRVTAANY